MGYDNRTSIGEAERRLMEPNHILAARLQLVGIARTMNQFTRWLIANGNNLSATTLFIIQAMMLRIMRYGMIVHLILNHPEINHPITNIFQ